MKKVCPYCSSNLIDYNPEKYVYECSECGVIFSIPAKKESGAIFGTRSSHQLTFSSRQLRRDVELGKIVIDKEGVIRCPSCNRNYNDYLAEFEKKGGSSCNSCWEIWG